eukprot:jgi/Mesen1/9471/ME000063S08927
MATHVLKASVVLSALVPHKASSCTILQNSVELGALSGGKGLSSKRVQRICLRKRSGPSEMSPRAAINVAEVAAEVGKSEITWQVAAGAVAGVTPFVVAGVEFSKRIVSALPTYAVGAQAPHAFNRMMLQRVSAMAVVEALLHELKVLRSGCEMAGWPRWQGGHTARRENADA